MQLNYRDPQTSEDLVSKTREFVDEVVIPTEREHLGRGPVEESTIESLKEQADERGIRVPHVSEEYGGLGQDFREMLPVFEQAGRSLLGPAALQIDGPDQPNMSMIELIGTDEQKERWLRPLVTGEKKSGFSMTEPRQGGGSDPKMLKTRAVKDGDEWVISGHKWWTSQGLEADFLIVMARTDMDAHPYAGCSMFLVPADADGVDIKRAVPSMGEDLVEVSHAEIEYDHVRVPDENLLGELNDGFAHAQQRLGPARLTHCMRFSGMAERAISVSKAYAAEREAFGDRLTNKQAVQNLIAHSEIKLHAVRTMARHAADEVADGHEARMPLAMCKVFVANAINDIVDNCLQVCGGNGIGKDLPLAYFYERTRGFRIFDGPDEVHLSRIARESLESIDSAELESTITFNEALLD